MEDVSANMLVFTNDGLVNVSVGRDPAWPNWSDWRYDGRFHWSSSGGRSGGRPGVVVNRVLEPENGGRLS